MTRARDVSSRGGLTAIIPTSVTVGGGSASVGGNGSITLTGATTISLINCFSSTYDNYKFTFAGTSATAGNIVSYQIGGNASSEYKFLELQANSGGSAPANANFSNTNTTGRLGVLSNNNSYFEADFYSPFLSGFTSWKSFANRTDATLTMYSYFGHVANTSSYTSISIQPTYALTGKLFVYGYNNG